MSEDLKSLGMFFAFIVGILVVTFLFLAMMQGLFGTDPAVEHQRAIELIQAECRCEGDSDERD